MPLAVIEKACSFAPDLSKGEVVIESDYGQENFASAFEELTSPDAVRLALTYAKTRGVDSPRLNGSTYGPYPVNSEGKPLDAVFDEKGEPYPMTHEKMIPRRYQITVPVCRPLF